MQANRLLLFLLLFLLIGHGAANAQTDASVLTNLIQKTVKYTDGHPIEKVYVDFDKPYYAIGDTVWLKAYVTIGLHQPSPLSKIVYVDVYTNRDSLVQSLKLPVINSVATGNFTLEPLQFKQGNYHLRAYTKYMRNYDSDYFFHKNITIGDLIENNVLTNISFSGAAPGNPSKTTAGIFFKDASGAPYANARVNWHVEVDYETIAKGKGNTDARGFLPINISSKQNVPLTAGTLFTEITTTDKKQVTSTFPLGRAAAAPDVQFFAEGGELVAGLRNNVAFKAIGPDGLGINIKGTVVDNDGKSVADIATTHLGMGQFTLMPDAAKTYRANITLPDGAKTMVDLPKVQPEGITVSVNNADTASLFLRISTNQPYLQKNQGKAFYIIARHAGIICYAAQTTLQALVYSASIPKTKFPTGILQITLLAADGTPLSERLAFINRHDEMKLGLSTAKTAYVSREKVSLKLNAKNQQTPAAANLSVAVIDETKVPYDEQKESTILNYLLLTSDLKGYIEKPNYYFTGENDKTIADLDLLMLTQGYRRIPYQMIMSGAIPEITFFPESGIDITGTLRDLTGLPIARGIVKLQVPDHSFTTQAVTNNLGEFVFPKVLVQDSSKVILSAKGNSGSNNMMIMLSGTAAQKVKPNPQAPNEILNIDSALNTYLQNSKRQYFNSRTLKEVTVTGVVQKKMVTHQDFPALTGLSNLPDQVITGDRLTSCNLFLMCLQSSFLSLIYVDNNLYVRRDYQGGNRAPVQIFVNGAPVDVNFLNSINGSEVESVEVFLKDDVSGINRTYGTNGVVEINLKKKEKPKKMTLQDIQNLLPQPSVVTFVPKGYSESRVFYSPKYEVTRSTMQGFDLRSTIYWNPRVITDKDGNAALDFYNADGKGVYRVIAEGIDDAGNIGHSEYTYKVQ